MVADRAQRGSPIASVSGQRGFTLLEVMVAVAILALTLTAVFSSQVGAFKSAQRARTTAVATLLARCKMNEVEQQIAIKGLPAVLSSGEDGCCEKGEVRGYTCKWKVERIVLPDLSRLQSQRKVAGQSNKPGSSADPASSAAAAPPSGTALPVPPSPGSLPGGGLAGGSSSFGNLTPSSVLSGSAGLGGDSMAQLAMSYALPVLKPTIEEQVRRATVTVNWLEGSRPHSFDVVQYLVAEQTGPSVDPANPSTAGGASGGSGVRSGSTGSSGTAASSGATGSAGSSGSAATGSSGVTGGR